MKSQGLQTQNMIIGPNVNADWTLNDVFNTNFITDFSDSLGSLTVEKLVLYYRLYMLVNHCSRYPSDNCAAVYHTGDTIRNPQDMLPFYLTHKSGQGIVQQYLSSAPIAIAAGKPLIMFETNTASCGGFVGISDAFVAALWGLDYGLTMAYSNFSGALFHVGGQNAYYNVSHNIHPLITLTQSVSAFHS
jgi:hypothetical protein